MLKKSPTTSVDLLEEAGRTVRNLAALEMKLRLGETVERHPQSHSKQTLSTQPTWFPGQSYYALAKPPYPSAPNVSARGGDLTPAGLTVCCPHFTSMSRATFADIKKNRL